MSGQPRLAETENRWMDERVWQTFMCCPKTILKQSCVFLTLK